MAESSKGEYKKILTCSRGEYEKILQAHGVNTRKYWLVEVIENGCIVTRYSYSQQRLEGGATDRSGRQQNKGKYINKPRQLLLQPTGLCVVRVQVERQVT